MSKYIDAEKLKAEIEVLKRRKGFLPFENTEITEAYMARGVQFTCDDIVKIIQSLQQEQPIQVNTLTWRDINDLERIINNVHYEFRSGIGEKSFGEEVLERFRAERDEQEQPEVDLEKEILNWIGDEDSCKNGKWTWYECDKMLRHFYELGKNSK